jgi:hypothetical protein
MRTGLYTAGIRSHHVRLTPQTRKTRGAEGDLPRIASTLDGMRDREFGFVPPLSVPPQEYAADAKGDISWFAVEQCKLPGRTQTTS